MTGIDRRGDTPMGPPWPVDVLADLHAGVYDAAVSDELWPRVRHDPGALGVLDALDATRAELSGLASAPAPRMPPEFAARLDAAIAAEAHAMVTAPAPRHPIHQQLGRHPGQPQPGQSLPGQALSGQPQPGPTPLAPHPVPPAPVVDLAQARRRRNQRRGWAAGVLVAAAAVAVVLALPHGGPPLQGVAEPPPATSDTGDAGPPQALTNGQLGSVALAAALGRTDYGPLADPARRAACLAANHQDPKQTPAGAMRVTLDGRPGVLLVLTTGVTAQYRLLVVGEDCAEGHPDPLADVVVGGVPPTTR
jgi:hypothetical protein